MEIYISKISQNLLSKFCVYERFVAHFLFLFLLFFSKRDENNNEKSAIKKFIVIVKLYSLNVRNVFISSNKL